VSPADLPEGIGLPDVIEHAAVVGILAGLINSASAYMNAPDGSEEEARFEGVLTLNIAQAMTISEDQMANLLLAACSLIVAVAPEEDAQAWFTHQDEKIQEALRG
jgi:hypothetical protein